MAKAFALVITLLLTLIVAPLSIVHHARSLRFYPPRSRVFSPVGRLSRHAAPVSGRCPQGSSCDDCPMNHYGPQCTICPACSSSAPTSKGRGRCDDGKHGTGACRTSEDANMPAFARCDDLSRPCDIAFAKPGGDLVMTTLLTSVKDPQRHVHRPCNARDTEC